MLSSLALVAGLASLVNAQGGADPSELAKSLGLTETFAYQFPDKPLEHEAADNYLYDNWHLNHGQIQFGAGDITFQNDPAGGSKRSLLARGDDDDDDDDKKKKDDADDDDDKKKSSSATSSQTSSAPTPSGTGASRAAAASALENSKTSLRIEYPAGSYSNATGGTQFYSQPVNATSDTPKPADGVSTNGELERMLLSYDIFFPSDFDFNKGGKLPGLRGGDDPHGCSGGHYPEDGGCFSARLMWREGGLGEVYAYVPKNGIKDFCKKKGVSCDADYGTSLHKGSFSFPRNKWQTVWLYVELNKVGTANGVVSLYIDGQQKFEMTNLEIRRNDRVPSIGGLYFSTFFGGNDESWASPSNQYTFFRNMQVFAGLGESQHQGEPTSAATKSTPSFAFAAAAAVVVVAASAFF